MNQLTDNHNYVVVWVFGIVVVCIIWWFAPSFYVSVQEVLPSTITARITNNFAEKEKQIARLQSKVSQLRQQNRQLQLTNKPNGLATSTLPDDHISASVIARPPRSPYDTLLLDTGRLSGVEVGAPVWWPPGVYLGDVQEVRADSALVSLVTSPGARHTGRIKNKATVQTTGQGGGTMEAVVPASMRVSTSSELVSDQYGAVFGSIAEVRSGSIANQQKLFVQPIIPVSVIDYVYVGGSK